MRVALPNGTVVSLGDTTRKLLRAKELFSWRLIRGAEGVSGISDAAAHYRTALAAHYRAAGLTPAAARRQAAADLLASPADRTAAATQATSEQARGLIGTGLGQTASSGTVSLIPPTIDITDTGQTLTIDGVDIVMSLLDVGVAASERTVANHVPTAGVCAASPVPPLVTVPLPVMEPMLTPEPFESRVAALLVLIVPAPSVLI